MGRAWYMPATHRRRALSGFFADVDEEQGLAEQSPLIADQSMRSLDESIPLDRRRRADAKETLYQFFDSDHLHHGPGDRLQHQRRVVELTLGQCGPLLKVPVLGC